MPGTLVAALLAAGWATADTAKIAKGKQVYQQACALCHGQDGNGNPEWESQVRPIEFGDCGTTAEPSDLWEHIVRKGGRAAGLDSVMPSFGEAYADDEIGAVVAYLRTFCAEADRYPPGDLNFRRPLKTGKAFPEQEWVLRTTHNKAESGRRETELELMYENRIGPRFQYELVLPLRAQGALRGVGDVEIEVKQVLAFSHKSLAILSSGLGVTLPTGSGSTTLVSPFVAFGKGFGRGRTFFQTKLGAELPADSAKGDAAIKYAAALSHSFGMSRRAFVPAVELTGAYNTKTRSNDYSAWLEVSKPLNALGHVIASVGVQIPIRPKAESWRLEAYLLWDFGDGPLWVGW